MDLHKIRKEIVNFFFPSVCFNCSEDISSVSREPLCHRCLTNLSYINIPYCKKCGIYLKNGGELCYKCLHSSSYNFDFSRSVFMYNDEISSLIFAYKYRKKEWLSEWFSKVMAEKIKDYPEFNKYNSLIYIPLAKNKLRKRGFNQTHIIASQLSLMLGLEIIEDAVIKTKEGKSQVELDAIERKKNVAGTFAIVKKNMVIHKNIIIIDDVATTMSTVDEMARILKNAGANKVSAYTIARE